MPTEEPTDPLAGSRPRSAARVGADADAWLERLPDLISTDHRRRGTCTSPRSRARIDAFGMTIPATRAERARDCCGSPTRTAGSSMKPTALVAWNGDGAVRLLEERRSRRAAASRRRSRAPRCRRTQRDARAPDGGRRASRSSGSRRPTGCRPLRRRSARGIADMPGALRVGPSAVRASSCCATREQMFRSFVHDPDGSRCCSTVTCGWTHSCSTAIARRDRPEAARRRARVRRGLAAARRPGRSRARSRRPGASSCRRGWSS